jgi:hypothetical protein
MHTSVLLFQNLSFWQNWNSIPIKHFCFTDYAKAFDYVDHNKLLKRCELLKRCVHQTILSVFWEICMWVKKQHLEPYMEQLIGSGLRN